MKAFYFEFIRLPPFVCQKFARENKIFTDSITGITKRLEFSAFFAFSCGDAGILKIPPMRQII